VSTEDPEPPTKTPRLRFPAKYKLEWRQRSEPADAELAAEIAGEALGGSDLLSEDASTDLRPTGTAEAGRSETTSGRVHRPAQAPRSDDKGMTAVLINRLDRLLRGRAADGTDLGNVATLGRGTVIIFTIQIVATAMRYVAQVLFARSGGPSNYGYYSFAYSLVNVLNGPVALGFTICVLRFVPGYAHEGKWSHLRGLLRRSVQLTYLTSFVCAAIAAGVILPVMGLHRQRGMSLLLAFAVLPAVAVVNLQKQFARASKNVIGAYTVGELLPPILIVLVTAAVLVSGSHLSGVAMLTITALGFTAVLPVQGRLLRTIFPLAFRQEPVAGRSRLHVPPTFETRVWLRVAAPLLVLVIITGVMNYADVLATGILRTAAETGAYSAANRVATIVSFFLVSVNGILAPLVVRTHLGGDRAALQRLLQSAVQWAVWPSVVCVIPMLLVPTQILSIFGHGYGGAATPLRILAFAQLVNAAAGPAALVLALTGHQQIVALLSGVALAVGLVMYAALVPSMGIPGAALGSAATTVVFNFWSYIEVRRRLHIRVYRFV
jgi:O-antigen/teichoic acid export membrane protein